MAKEVIVSDERNTIHTWLDPPDPSPNYNKALAQRHEGTGKWFADGEAFYHFKKGVVPFLWLHGISGCGKTILSSSIVRDLRQNTSQAVLYFYFDFNDINKQNFDDLSNLARHESPNWFDGAKFGIFIHWGPDSVTGWGNSTPYESYAEWFWWYNTHHPEADRSDFYDYRLRTFGPDWNYDDSFDDYTASRFDAKEWVDLFADAGATYFVLTTKHHDGFANFD